MRNVHCEEITRDPEDKEKQLLEVDARLSKKFNMLSLEGKLEAIFLILCRQGSNK